MGSLRPVRLIALSIKLTPVLGDEPYADEIDCEGPGDELGVDPVFHGKGAPSHRKEFAVLSHENQEWGSPDVLIGRSSWASRVL
jgi:hypothetical protein